MALHQQISTLIKDGIASGRYRAGDRLPTEESLCATHGVSRVTVRRAMQSLEQQGYIERRPRLGTFVCGGAAVLSMPTPIDDYLKQVARRRQLSRPVVLDFGFVSATPEVAASLRLAVGADVLRVERLRVMQKLPIFHSTVHLPETIGRRFTRGDFARTALSSLLAREGMRYGRIDMVTRARLAIPPVAGLLQVATGSALVDVQRIGYDTEGTPIEFQQLLGPPDRFETHVTMRSADAATSSGD